MDFNIVVDSCCDVTPEMQAQMGITSIPLTLLLGEKSYVDDENLDLPTFMNEMKNCKERIGTACPSPNAYKEAYKSDKTSFAITLSGNLSASNQSALLGKTMAEEERNAEVHVFDSKSASAGEVLITLKLRQLIDKGLHTAEIVAAVQNFIDNMKTYFILDNIDNLVKNGRMNKIVGKLITALNIKPLLGSDGNGNIALFSHARGEKQMIERLSDTVEKSGKQTEGQSMVIAHCNNPSLAQKLMAAVTSRYNFAEILIVPTKGLSSLYANDKGLIIAF